MLDDPRLVYQFVSPTRILLALLTEVKYCLSTSLKIGCLSSYSRDRFLVLIQMETGSFDSGSLGTLSQGKTFA